MIVLDYSDKRPIYEQVVDRLQTLIVSGVLEPDEKLPSVRALAMELSINPNTIQRAYSELERDGLIYSVKGRGNFVRVDQRILEIQQQKLIDAVKKQVTACRNQRVAYERILDCVREVYGEVPG